MAKRQVQSSEREFVEQPPTGATVPAVREAASGISVFERMASDPSVDVTKLEKLMELWERGQARTAREQFNAAMTAAQTAMRPVAADADNPQTRSRYASYAALDRALRPIYVQHGLALSFNTDEPPAADVVRVLCDVTHIGGHAKTYRLDMPADGKGAKGGDVMTKTHATGSAVSYGMRYLLKMIFNVAIGEYGDDGNKAGQRAQRPQSSDRAESAAPPSTGQGVQGGLKVSDRQIARMWKIASEVGRDQRDVRAWIKKRFHLREVEDLLRKDYDTVCQTIEGPGELG